LLLSFFFVHHQSIMGQRIAPMGRLGRCVCGSEREKRQVEPFLGRTAQHAQSASRDSTPSNSSSAFKLAVIACG
jgi:hypothetical protein